MLQTSQIYGLDCTRARYAGIKINDGLSDYLAGRVFRRYHDVAGTDELANEFSDVGNSGFLTDHLKGIFSHEHESISWRIGETFSECYLEDFCNARFPYSVSRDAKNPLSSLPGADLVGFACLEDKTLFLFGEVKTSSQKSPPSVVNDLKRQLQKIKSEKSIRKHLITWLGFKFLNARDSEDKKAYKKALDSYLESDLQVKIAGILIRDTNPDCRDLEGLFNNLKEIHEKMHLELIAFYLPVPISELEAKMRHGKLD